ncbi:MAG: single-stranded-DNA-specific exonuclease RecJ [Gammaproteobacteria bacterium]|jgi:single-stranded-DNA-specific exonuclease
MSSRIVRRPLPDSGDSLPADLHPLLRRVYAARAVASAGDLDYSLTNLLPLRQLAGLPAAVELLYTALAERWRILVVGDFDADGATSCALCLRALRLLGAADVDYLVPNRFEYGYGLTPEIVAVAARRHPDLVLTVDNGISSREGVAAAKQRGIRVLVTDHHLPGECLPEADAIVNPNLPDNDFPSKHLAGVGVAFYVMLGLRAHLRECGWFAARQIVEPNLAQFLDLVALGTVADVVPLDRNNRILVQQGIRRIRAGQCVPGLRALLEVAGRDPSRVIATDLGFAAGPRLNAAGRLEDMSLGIECLLTDDAGSARTMASQLDGLNRERREIESDMQAQALAALGDLELDDASLPLGLCLFDPDWHQGVIGILAARIKERFHRPVIAFARSGKGELKGSARSVGGLHIRDVLDAVATRHPRLIARFGGHAMAAGLTLAEEDYPAFAAAFDAEVARHLVHEELGGVIHSDGELQEQELSLEIARLLRDASPWGQGFPAPLFDGDFTVLDQRVVGERHLKLSLRPAGGRGQIDAIAFNTASLSPGCSAVHLAYRLDVNAYRGTESAQLVVEHIDASGLA